MHRPLNIPVLRVLCAALLVVLASTAFSQTYPNRAVRIVVPWPAGGPPDTLGRLVAQRLGETFKQQVIVENRPGANSIIGTEAVAKSPPDGYTYLLTTGSHVHNAALYTRLPYDTRRDFVSLTLVAETAGMVLGVHPSVPAKSVKELVALARQQPGKLTFGSAGNGNTLHLAGELFKVSTGTDLTHVPYKGAAPALNDLLGGHIDMMFASPVSMAPPINAGRLRGLAQTGERRSHVVPQLPTLGELGIRGAEMSGWYGLYAPAKTPKEYTDRMVSEILKTIREADTSEKVRALGVDAVGMPQEQFERYLVTEIDKYAKLAKRIKLQLN